GRTAEVMPDQVPVSRYPAVPWRAAAGKLAGMPDPFADRFAAVRAVRGPLVLGADPHRQVLESWGLTDDADGLERFTDIVLDAAAGTVGLVKPQSAFYERHGWRGIRALTRLAESARAPGPLGLPDAQRGHRGSTNA